LGVCIKVMIRKIRDGSRVRVRVKVTVRVSVRARIKVRVRARIKVRLNGHLTGRTFIGSNALIYGFGWTELSDLML
jgi:hypothetical protein